jgi:Raf kinase inhibitor-like YbhB/YbcL family protein
MAEDAPDSFVRHEYCFARGSRMKITSTAFEHGSLIPREYTCEGADRSPPLSFADVPQEAKSLAVVIDDPDAPDPRAPRRVWSHWILYNLPPATAELAAGVRRLPPGTLLGRNDSKHARYDGPCPPIGKHRYFHKLYALDAVLPDLGEPTKAELERAMAPHVIARAELIGTYEKGR